MIDCLWDMRLGNLGNAEAAKEYRGIKLFRSPASSSLRTQPWPPASWFNLHWQACSCPESLALAVALNTTATVLALIPTCCRRDRPTPTGYAFSDRPLILQYFAPTTSCFHSLYPFSYASCLLSLFNQNSFVFSCLQLHKSHCSGV